MPLEVLEDYIWPTQPFTLAIVAGGVDALAARLGLPLKDWEEDGLGAVRGIGVRLPNGRVVLIREYAHVVQHGRFSGPELVVDASDVAAHGVEPLLQEVLGALGIQVSAVEWRQPVSAAAVAAATASAAKTGATRRPRTLDPATAKRALDAGRSVEQWLGATAFGSDTILRWVRLDREKDGTISWTVFEVFDDGSPDFLDVYDFTPAHVDLPHGVTRSFMTSAEAFDHISELGGSPTEFVGAGMIQDEYADYLSRSRRAR